MNSKDPINSRALANFVSVHLPWQGNALPLSHSRTYTILSFGAGDEIYELKGSYKLACISELCERPFALARGASYH